jgi:putative membrane protein
MHSGKQLEPTFDMEKRMIRTLSIFALSATALALPAYAGEPTANDTAAVSVHATELADAYAAKQAHRLLASQGYLNISALERNENGHWTGTALKDGKTIFVAIALPSPKAVAETN